MRNSQLVEGNTVSHTRAFQFVCLREACSCDRLKNCLLDPAVPSSLSAANVSSFNIQPNHLLRV